MSAPARLHIVYNRDYNPATRTFTMSWTPNPDCDEVRIAELLTAVVGAHVRTQVRIFHEQTSNLPCSLTFRPCWTERRSIVRPLDEQLAPVLEAQGFNLAA